MGNSNVSLGSSLQCYPANVRYIEYRYNSIKLGTSNLYNRVIIKVCIQGTKGKLNTISKYRWLTAKFTIGHHKGMYTRYIRYNEYK